MDQVRIGKRAADGENEVEAHDDGPPPIRRSGRIASHESDMKIRPFGIAKPSNMVLVPNADGARFLGSITLADRNLLMAAAEKKKKEEEEAKKKKEEEEQLKIMIAQDKFDEEGKAMTRELYSVLRPATLEEAQDKIMKVRRVIFRLKEGISKALKGVGTAMMDCALSYARKLKEHLKNSIEEFQEEQAEQKKIEEEREKRKKVEEERKKKEGEWKKKEEEDGKMTEEERKERDAKEAARIAKECKICYGEMSDGVGCMLCMQPIGCKTCVTNWLMVNKSCPFCRRKYASVHKQVKSVEWLEIVKARKLIVKKPRTPPTRISPRGHPSSQ